MATRRAENEYRVLEQIAAGGMAEVYRAESASLGDFRKSVAIKRVLPSLANNERFLRMFLDEARLSARLNHRNIVQVFDVGRDAESYFIVMEFVDGVTLKAVMEHVHARGKTVAVPLVVHVGIEMCAGLHYAHRLADDAGRPLGIVHRDVSPSNVLLERSGGVKVVDFGVAKASTQIEKTDPGVVKGKLSYLAPELALGKEADGQADLFATGVVLWEMLAGRSLFRGKTEYETTKNVRAARVPSLLEINPAVPAALDAVLRKALARDKNERYPDAAAFARALTGVQFEQRMPVDAEDLGNLVREVLEVQQGGEAPPPGQGANTVIGTKMAPSTFSIQSLTGEPLSTPRRASTRPRRGLLAAGLGVALGVAAVGLGWRRHAPAETAASTTPADTVAPVAPSAPAPSPAPSARATTVDTALPSVAPSASADAGAHLEPAQDVPSWVQRNAVFHAAQQQVYGCSERYGAQGRHARVFVTYDGATGAARDVRINGTFFEHRAAGRCIERAVRDHPVYPFRDAQWTTDYEFTVP